MVLDDGVEEGWVAGEALRRDYVLACVVAFGGAVPEEEAVLEGWRVWISHDLRKGSLRRRHTYVKAIGPAISFYAFLPFISRCHSRSTGRLLPQRRIGTPEGGRQCCLPHNDYDKDRQ